ncbi:ATP-binding protein [uncultured Lacinutrix sp.]|uniref:tetratricopeptide repeat-containing hybrid sensor histidine kinase/response regulator n=1 Tax=uncultured Lacinutrix sp. TaxID=574032 RepID=UPI0026159461|nr:ATP-binding protein [uncultured Lacinutrix sp.]
MKTYLKKCYYFGLVAVFCLVCPVYAQQEPDLTKFMYAEVDRAYELNQRTKYGEAIEVTTKVLKFANKVNDDYLKAKAYNNLGTSHYYVNNEDLSFDYLFKSKDISVKLKDTSRIIIAYNNLGVNYRAYGKLSESNIFFKKSLNLAEVSKAQKELVFPLFNIGVNLIEKEEPTLDDYKESYKTLKRAEVLAHKYYNEEAIVGEVFEVLSYVHHRLGDKQESLEYYNKVLEYTQKHNYLEVKAEAHSVRASIYVEENDFEKAYYALEDYVTTIDSVYSLKEFEKAKQIEANNFLKENDLKLKLVEKEKRLQALDIERTRTFNGVLIFFTVILLLLGFWIHKKNTQLKLAKDKAENLSKVKSDFYSEISHELRTPLYAVIELSGLLLKENVSVKHKEYIESLRFSGNHLMSLINNVLELNKVESGKMKIQQIDFDLKNLVSNIIESLEYALRDSNNTISFKYDDSIPKSLTGDSLKVSQILINLISNAIKFTNNGHIEIEINKLKDIDEDEVVLAFKIVDNGSGISEEMQSQVFEDFYQEHSKNGRSYKGTGLGLSIVKRLLVVMGSDINVISKENEGSTFFFELNFRVTEIDSLPIIIYKSQLEYIKNKNFLIVDDNKINQLVTRKVLDNLDIKSKAVDSGAKAIAIVKEEEFDCILMDIHMPELDGYETTELIREFNRDVAIVALTAATKNEVEVKASMHGMDDYILKPFITKDFVETITKAMHRRQ